MRFSPVTSLNSGGSCVRTATLGQVSICPGLNQAGDGYDVHHLVVWGSVLDGECVNRRFCVFSAFDGGSWSHEVCWIDGLSYPRRGLRVAGAESVEERVLELVEQGARPLYDRHHHWFQGLAHERNAEHRLAFGVKVGTRHGEFTANLQHFDGHHLTFIGYVTIDNTSHMIWVDCTVLSGTECEFDLRGVFTEERDRRLKQRQTNPLHARQTVNEILDDLEEQVQALLPQFQQTLTSAGEQKALAEVFLSL